MTDKFLSINPSIGGAIEKRAYFSYIQGVIGWGGVATLPSDDRARELKGD